MRRRPTPAAARGAASLRRAPLSRRRRLAAGALVAGGSLLALAVLAAPADHELGFEPRAPVPVAAPPLPPPGTFPFQLVLDDNAAEGVFGFSGATARQFLWFNSFFRPGPLLLEEIWVLFPAGMDVPVGGAIQLLVWLDSDGIPGNGAQLLASYDETVQVADGNTFSVYTLPAPLPVISSNDLMIGVVNRFFATGVDPPPTLPAALDTSASQDRSYFALWSGNPPDPPDLATATTVELLDGAINGNFMIRGFGSELPLQFFEAPTLDRTGLAVLGVLLAAVGAVLLGLRRQIS